MGVQEQHCFHARVYGDTSLNTHGREDNLCCKLSGDAMAEPAACMAAGGRDWGLSMRVSDVGRLKLTLYLAPTLDTLLRWMLARPEANARPASASSPGSSQPATYSLLSKILIPRTQTGKPRDQACVGNISRMLHALS